MLDLLLLDTPFADSFSLAEQWAAMEKLVTSGKVKHIGLSKFSLDQIQEVVSIAKIKPAAVEFSLS